jgi:hypothetical protein
LTVSGDSDPNFDDEIPPPVMLPNETNGEFELVGVVPSLEVIDEYQVRQYWSENSFVISCYNGMPA